MGGLRVWFRRDWRRLVLRPTVAQRDVGAAKVAPAGCRSMDARSGGLIVRLSRCCRLAALALPLLAGCSPAPPAPDQATQQAKTKPGCGVGGNARGIAAGFFALFQDRPECF